MRYFIFILALLLVAPAFSVAQSLDRDDALFVGAQVFIEPGQTDAQVDGWFRTLRENGMGVCRIRMFESYMDDGRDGCFSMSRVRAVFRILRSSARPGRAGWKTILCRTSPLTDIRCGRPSVVHDRAAGREQCI